MLCCHNELTAVKSNLNMKRAAKQYIYISRRVFIELCNFLGSRELVHERTHSLNLFIEVALLFENRMLFRSL